MAQWNNDEELFNLTKEKLYTPVVGDILDQMGYKHQFLPAAIRPLEAVSYTHLDVYKRQLNSQAPGHG